MGFDLFYGHSKFPQLLCRQQFEETQNFQMERQLAETTFLSKDTLIGLPSLNAAMLLFLKRMEFQKSGANCIVFRRTNFMLNESSVFQAVFYQFKTDIFTIRAKFFRSR